MGAREKGAREKDTWRDSVRSVRPHILRPNACYAGYDTCYNCNFNKPRPSCMTWLCIVWAIRIIRNNKRERADVNLNQQILTKLCIWRSATILLRVKPLGAEPRGWSHFQISKGISYYFLGTRLVRAEIRHWWPRERNRRVNSSVRESQGGAGQLQKWIQ